MKRLYINEDNASFYDCRPQKDMSVEGLEGLVDLYASGASVAGVFFNVNVQRALFDSQVWEPLYYGYDPDGPDDQPGLAFLSPEGRSLTPDKRGRWWVHNLWLLKNRGIDHPKVWLDRCRHHGLEGWLTMRMNDCHHNPHPEAFWHCSFWKERPDLHRARHRDEGWFETAFDYGKAEVVEHHLALLRELCGRYDMHGIELDWMRWVKHFAPGGEAAGRQILTNFMREARQLTENAAQRLGHPVQLAVRLPTLPQSAWAWGYDVSTWAAEGLIDLVTLAPFLEQSCFEFDIPLWRAILGSKVRILAQPDASMHVWPNSGSAGKIRDYNLLFASAAAALQDGADGTYLFNECYRANPHDGTERSQPGILKRMLDHAGDLERLRDHPRRQAVSYHQVPGPGMAIPCVLPIALRREEDWYDLGRFRAPITLRLPLGPKPNSAKVTLRLGLDADAEACEGAGFQVWINSAAIPASTNESSVEKLVIFPKVVAKVLEYAVPLSLLLEGINIVEVLPPAHAGRLVWAEFAVG
jgi:hypothetical protein